MSNTVICRILPTNQQNAAGHNQSNGTGIVILEIHPASGAARRMSIAKQQDLKLGYGDKIVSIAGKAGVLINPGSPAGIFILCPHVPPNSDWKVRTELEINDETTKAINRGSISVTQDIGNISRGTGGATR